MSPTVNAGTAQPCNRSSSPGPWPCSLVATRGRRPMPSRLPDSVRADDGTGGCRMNTGEVSRWCNSGRLGALPDYHSRDGGDRVGDRSAATARGKACTSARAICPVQLMHSASAVPKMCPTHANPLYVAAKSPFTIRRG